VEVVRVIRAVEGQSGTMDRRKYHGTRRFGQAGAGNGVHLPVSMRNDLYESDWGYR